MKLLRQFQSLKYPNAIQGFCLNYEKTEYLQSLSLLNTVFRKGTHVL